MAAITGDTADLSVIQSRRVAVIGDYHGHGHAQALSLRDCGVDVLVGLPAEPADAVAGATDDGLPVAEPAQAAAQADVVMLLAADDTLRRHFDTDIAPNLADGDALLLRSPVTVRYGLVKPPPTVDVGLVAPLAPGELARAQFVDGKGVPCLVAVDANVSGQAWPLVLAYAKAIGATRAGLVPTTFAEQAQASLFGEQAVRLGGVPALVRAAFEVLVAAGCGPEVAYVACLHELHETIERLYRGGLAGLREGTPAEALYGGLTRGPLIAGDAVREELRGLLAEIVNGSFVAEWVAEDEAGRPTLRELVEQDDRHGIEQAGRRLRERMPWLDRR